LKKQADGEMTLRLNSDSYSDKETVTFKFPLALPYHKDWNAFERMNGTFENNGEYFNFIKQKIERDTLYLVCIRDYKVKQISGLVTDFVKLSNDIPTNSKTIKLFGNFTQDYEFLQDYYSIRHYENPFIRHNCFYLTDLFMVDLTIPAPPPKS
jgi:hypothetical protein